jgi:hypothetical protein
MAGSSGCSLCRTLLKQTASGTYRTHDPERDISARGDAHQREIRRPRSRVRPSPTWSAGTPRPDVLPGLYEVNASLQGRICVGCAASHITGVDVAVAAPMYPVTVQRSCTGQQQAVDLRLAAKSGT